MRLSVVSTLYRSAAYLREFYARVSAEAERFAEGDYEIVLVNDGSPDESLALALGLQAADPRVRVIDLSRNFGHHAAMWAGLEHACGDDVFLIDCDLQERPEWLAELAAARESADADVAFGVQASRDGPVIERLGGKLFYKAFNALCDDPLPENLMTIRLMSRRYLDALMSHREVTFIIAGLWARTGFRQVGVPLAKEHRRGKTTYSLFARAAYMVQALTAFSSKPLVFGFYLGSAIVLVSMLVAFGLVVARLCGSAIQSGWPSLMVSVWMLGGLILFCQGIHGMYLARVYLETKRRPVTIVRQIYETPREVPRERVRAAG